MTLIRPLRGLLALPLAVMLALGPQAVPAMITDGEEEAAASTTNAATTTANRVLSDDNDDDGDAPPGDPPPAVPRTSEREREAARVDELGRRMQRRYEQRQTLLLDRLLREELEAGIAADASATTSASSTTTAGTAARAAPAPATAAEAARGLDTRTGRGKLSRQGAAYNLNRATAALSRPSEVESRSASTTAATTAITPPELERDVTPPPPKVASTVLTASADAFEAELAKGEPPNYALFRENSAPNRREDVRAALRRLDQAPLEPTAKGLGILPPELARALLKAGDQPDGIALLRASADPVRGIATDGKGNFIINPGELITERLKALDEVEKTAKKAKEDYKKGSPLRVALKGIAEGAAAERRALIALLNESLSDYPLPLAEVDLPRDALGKVLGSGANSSVQGLSFDFATGKVRAGGPVNAVFKATETDIKASAGLENAGVDFNDNTPLRLEQRAIATRRVAEALGYGAMVVDTRIARLTERDGTAHMGLVMERAPGRQAVADVLLDQVDAADLGTFLDLEAQMQEATDMLAFLNGERAAPPQIPNRPGLDRTNWQKSNWEANRDSLAGMMDRMAIRNVRDANGRTHYYSLRQIRTVTDAHLADPDLRRQLSDAQFLDLICGQADRHMGNLVIDTSVSPPRLRLIDNDLSFGSVNAGYGLKGDTWNTFLSLPTLPVTIDFSMQKAILGADPDTLRAAVGGLLSEAEINAMVERLTWLKAYVASDKVRVVDMPFRARPRALRWDGDPAVLFIGDPVNGPISANGAPTSNYSLLKTRSETPQLDR